MRIAEALAQRKDLTNKIGRDFSEYALDRLTYEDVEGTDVPSTETAQSVLEEVKGITGEIARLSVSINEVNNDSKIEFEGDTSSLMEAISQRDALSREIAVLNSLVQSVENATNSGSRRRYGGYRSKDDVVIKPVIPLSELRSYRDSRSATLRRLDIEIQKVNWETDLP